MNPDVYAFLEELELHRENLRAAVDSGDWHSASYNTRQLVWRAMHLVGLLDGIPRVERDRHARGLRVEREQGR